MSLEGTKSSPHKEPDPEMKLWLEETGIAKSVEEEQRRAATQKGANAEETTPVAAPPTEKKDPLDMTNPSPEGAENSVDEPVSPETWELGEQEVVSGSERTPKEWREKLKNLISGAAEQVIGGERGKQLKKERLEGFLGGRSKDLNEKARGLGPLAFETVSSVAERYNKLNWKTKLAVTGALMLGVSATAISAPLVSGALAGALYGQRAIGAIGLGMNKRKKLDAKIAANPEHWMANKPELMKNAYAAALAGVYLVGTSFAVHEGVEFLRSIGVGEWFGGAPDVSSTHGTPDTPDMEPSSHESVTGAPDNTIDTADEPPVVGHESAQPESSASASVEQAPQADAPVPAESADAASAAPEETPTNPDIKPIDAKPDGSLAAKEFGAEYAEPETTPEDLSAKEWGAEYAEPVNHTGAPDWRAEHTESDFAPEAQTEAPTQVEATPQAPITEKVVTAPNAVPADTPPAPPETPPVAAPEVNHFVVNIHGLSIDEAHAAAYLDTQGNHIIYGGSLDAKAELAKQLVSRNHSSVVFFESTRPEKFLGFFEREVPHLSMAQWVEAGGESGVHIAEDTNTPSLVGIMLPTANDLAQVYKPAN